MKPNFTEMNTPDLRAYVLENRDDLEAIRILFSRRTPNSKSFPPLYKDGIPIEENIQIMEEAIKQRIEQENNRKKTIRFESAGSKGYCSFSYFCKNGRARKKLEIDLASTGSPFKIACSNSWGVIKTVSISSSSS